MITEKIINYTTNNGLYSLIGHMKENIPNMLMTDFKLEEGIYQRLDSLARVMTQRSYDNYASSHPSDDSEKIFIKKALALGKQSVIIAESIDLPFVIFDSFIPIEYISFVLNSAYGEYYLSGRTASSTKIQGIKIKLSYIKDTLIPLNEYIDTCALFEVVFLTTLKECESTEETSKRNRLMAILKFLWDVKTFMLYQMAEPEVFTRNHFSLLEACKKDLEIVGNNNHVEISSIKIFLKEIFKPAHLIDAFNKARVLMFNSSKPFPSYIK